MFIRALSQSRNKRVAGLLFLSLFSQLTCVLASSISLTWLRFPTEIELWPAPELGSGTFGGMGNHSVKISDNPIVARIQVFGELQDFSDPIIRFDFGEFDLNIRTYKFQPSISLESADIVLSRHRFNTDLQIEHNFIAILSTTQVRILAKAANGIVLSRSINLPKRVRGADIYAIPTTHSGEFGTSSRVRFSGQQELGKILDLEGAFLKNGFRLQRIMLSGWLIVSVGLFIRTAIEFSLRSVRSRPSMKDLG